MKASVERSGADREKGLDPEEQYFKQWVVSTQCCANMAHNALKWAVRQQYPIAGHAAELGQACADGRITHALVVAACFWFRERFGSWSVPERSILDLLPSDEATPRPGR